MLGVGGEPVIMIFSPGPFFLIIIQNPWCHSSSNDSENSGDNRHHHRHLYRE